MPGSTGVDQRRVDTGPCRRFEALGGTVLTYDLAGPSVRDPELVFKHDHGLTATVRGHHFSLFKYFNIALSNSASANNFFNVEFSTSSSLRRFASSAFIPPC